MRKRKESKEIRIACTRVRNIVDKHYHDSYFDIDILSDVVDGVCKYMNPSSYYKVMKIFMGRNFN